MRFRGSVWRDWVVVDWGAGFGKIPNKIWGFVDLSKLRKNSRIKFGGINQLEPTVYAVVESAGLVDGSEETELLKEVETEVEDFSVGGYVTKYMFYLAPVDAFVEPAVVIPNIGGGNNSYLWLTAWPNWRHLFVTWLHKPYQDLSLDEPEEAQNDDISEAGSDEEENEKEALGLLADDEVADEVETDDDEED
jgi:hypothetical protein